jgi:hypothetical protein
MNKFLVGAVITSLFAASAFSSVINFTNDPLAAAIDAATTSYAGVTEDGVSYTITSNIGDLTAHERCYEVPGSYYDGIGITELLPPDDEITGPAEILTLSFDKAVQVQNVTVFDLFWEDNNTPNTTVAGTPTSYLETGRYSVNGGVWVDFSASTSSLKATGGLRVLDLGNTYVESIAFTAVSRTPGNNDFALAKVNYSVPEPATLSFLGFGLLSLAAFFRRKRS